MFLSELYADSSITGVVDYGKTVPLPVEYVIITGISVGKYQLMRTKQRTPSPSLTCSSLKVGESKKMEIFVVQLLYAFSVRYFLYKVECMSHF